MELDPDPVLEIYDLIQSGGTVDFSQHPPWIAQGYRLLVSEIHKGSRLRDSHDAAVAAMRAEQAKASR